MDLTLNSQDDTSFVIFYAFPRSTILIEVPLTIRSTYGAAFAIPAKGKCLASQRLNPDDACYWDFRPVKALKALKDLKDDELYQCKDEDKEGGALHTLLSISGPVKSSVVPVPDPGQIYSMDITPGLLQRMKANMEFSATGAPTKYLIPQVSHSMIRRG